MNENNLNSKVALNNYNLIAGFYEENKLKMINFFFGHIRHRTYSNRDTLELARDLTQDAFTLAVNYGSGDQKIEYIEAFMWKTARNRLKMFFRQDSDYLDFMHNTRERDLPSMFGLDTLDVLLKQHYSRIIRTDENLTSRLDQALSGDYCDSNPEEDQIINEEADYLLRCISEMKPELRNTLVLFYFHNMSYSEIAKMYGVMQSRVKSWGFRAKKHLSEKMREHYLPKSEVWDPLPNSQQKPF